MSFRIRIYLLCCCLFAIFSVNAQLPTTPDGVKQPRILILLDGSSSMLAPWDKGIQRFQAAGNLVAELMDSIYKVNANVEFGLRVYGHQYPAQQNNCFDTRTEVMFSKDNYTQMGLRIASLHPSGVSPMAYALKEAAINDLGDELHNAYSIILISDGGESCNGNVCDVVQKLIQRKIYFKSYIISLVNTNTAADKNSYQCLGDQLIADSKTTITSAVKRIVDDYRPSLKAPIKITMQEIEAAKTKNTAEPVDIRTIVLPTSLSERQTFATMPVAIQGNKPVKLEYSNFIRKVKILVFAFQPIPREPKEEPAPIILPVKRSNDQFNILQPIITKFIARQLQYNKMLRPSKSPQFAYLPIPKEPPPIVEKPLPKQEITTSLSPSGIRKMPEVIYYYRAIPKFRRQEYTYNKIEKQPAPVAVVPKTDTVKRTTVIVTEIPKAPSKPLPKPITSNSIKPVEIKFTTSAEDAKETTVQIFFTDGHGKFYKSTPKLQLTNASGVAVKSFFRTIDASGSPDPVAVPAGTYTLTFPGKAKTLLKNLVIEPNKNNKIIAVVSNGSIIFRYEGAPDRPVSEFEALVNILFEPGPTVQQRCTAEIEYAPGNYHVEVNTLPITRYNVDVDFGNVSVLTLKQPGYIQFMNTNAVGKISLYHTLGDQFARFYVMELNGNPASQKLMLQPGVYEVHWLKKPVGPVARENIQKFNVQSNAVTEITLEQ